MKCIRCAESTPRLTVDQRYCRRCDIEVAALLRVDARRKARQTWTAKDTTSLVLVS